MRTRLVAALLIVAFSTGCATGKRWVSLAGDDARALAAARPDRRTLAAAGAIVAAAALDEAVRDGARANTSGGADEASKITGPFGGRYSDRVMAGFLVAGLASGNDRAKAVAFDSFVSSLVASKVVTPVLKEVVGRARPNESEGAFEFEGGSSFPSNHATQAFAVASVIAAHYDSRWVDTAAYGLATLVGASRIYDDAHWLSDVVAGAVIGTATGRLVVRTNERGRAKWALRPVWEVKRRGVMVTIALPSK